MVELQQSQAQPKGDASVMDEIAIFVPALGRIAETILGLDLLNARHVSTRTQLLLGIWKSRKFLHNDLMKRITLLLSLHSFNSNNTRYLSRTLLLDMNQHPPTRSTNDLHQLVL